MKGMRNVAFTIISLIVPILSCAPLFAVAQTVSASPSCAFTEDLSFGSSGPEVLCLQESLVSAHLLAVDPTGYFGLLTQAAVQLFQAQEGIVTSGTPLTTGYGAFGPRTR